MLASLLALALSAHGADVRVPLDARGDSFGSSLSLVDRMAWAATARDVERFVRDATQPTSVFSRSFAESARAHATTLKDPTIYAVEARVLDGGEGISVRMAAVYTNQSGTPLEILILRALPAGQEDPSFHMAVTGAWVNGRRSAHLLEDTVLVLALPEPLPPGKRARVLLETQQLVPEFDPRDRTEVDRVTSEQTGAYGRHAGIVNLGFWLPLFTPSDRNGLFDVRALPVNGEHAWFDPAVFHVVLDVPAAYSVATTGVELHRVVHRERASVVAVASAAREFAVQLGLDMHTTDTRVGETRVRVFHPADEELLGRHLEQYAARAVQTLSAAYGPLPLAELDVFEAPVRTALGNEFPGLVTVDMHYAAGSYHRNKDHEWTVAHEVAHQWWAGEVGSDARGEPWVDEALASHGAALYWEQRYGRPATERRFELLAAEPYARMDVQGVKDLPANLPGERYDLLQYSTIVYGRGMVFFDLLRQAMGEEAFGRAMRRYYRENHCAMSSGSRLLMALRAEAPDPARVVALYERWIDGAHGIEDFQ